MKKIEKYIKSLLSEAAKINFAGHTFVLKIDTNEDPQKKGVKVQFLPTKFGSITPTEQNDIAIELEKRLMRSIPPFDTFTLPKYINEGFFFALKGGKPSNHFS